MSNRAAPESHDLRTTLHGIVERFATARGATAARTQHRVMADDLVLDLIGALRNASLGEVAALVALLERQQKNRPASATPKVTSHPARPPRPPAPPLRKDAFEITMPDELLDSVGRPRPRDEELPPPASVKRVRAPSPPVTRRPRQPRVTEQAEPAPPQQQEEEARPPVVALREGEQLVRASGSGVVIRRARSA